MERKNKKEASTIILLLMWIAISIGLIEYNESFTAEML